MKELDCLSEMCPIPIIKIQKALKTLEKGSSIKVITDHSCVVQSILDRYNKPGTSVRQEEVINGVWEIIITLI